MTNNEINEKLDDNEIENLKDKLIKIGFYLKIKPNALLHDIAGYINVPVDEINKMLNEHYLLYDGKNITVNRRKSVNNDEQKKPKRLETREFKEQYRSANNKGQDRRDKILNLAQDYKKMGYENKGDSYR